MDGLVHPGECIGVYKFNIDLLVVTVKKCSPLGNIRVTLNRDGKY